MADTGTRCKCIWPAWTLNSPPFHHRQPPTIVSRFVSIPAFPNSIPIQIVCAHSRWLHASVFVSCSYICICECALLRLARSFPRYESHAIGRPARTSIILSVAAAANRMAVSLPGEAIRNKRRLYHTSITQRGLLRQFPTLDLPNRTKNKGEHTRISFYGPNT